MTCPSLDEEEKLSSSFIVVLGGSKVAAPPSLSDNDRYAKLSVGHVVVVVGGTSKGQLGL